MFGKHVNEVEYVTVAIKPETLEEIPEELTKYRLELAESWKTVRIENYDSIMDNWLDFVACFYPACYNWWRYSLNYWIDVERI